MIRGALKNPYLVVVLVLMVFVIGMVSYARIPADLLPTLLDLIGQVPGERVDGRSLAPLFGPDAEEIPWRNTIVLESRHETRNQGIPQFGAVRSERFKWIEYENGENALYDLENDPYEMTNVANGSYGAVASELSERLRRLLECSGATCREVEDVPLEAMPADR